MLIPMPSQGLLYQAWVAAMHPFPNMGESAAHHTGLGQTMATPHISEGGPHLVAAVKLLADEAGETPTHVCLWAYT